ncbi:NADH-cytochrome b5 reductase 1-like 2 [Homarus americanus]|uniref:NADH-cytochrome b5 reductase 1-like 2 n=1 Tax=Homarus americanus TaxID=6706 RepID=A0A8J5MRM0_HOMAM|nr:NADH-cytochrome b5 reductase 1-like 2 [Homarus americanus]
MKTWGNKEFWGLGSEFDPDWLLTDQQKQLRADLMDVCRTKIRPHAIQCDRNYQFPRQSVEDLAELGLMGLIIPKEFGGLGENHICAAMVVETLARYGCPSTAMIYTMHLASCSVILFRYHNNPHLQQLLTRITQEKLLGAVSASDPATGGHDWFPLSSKVKYLDKRTIQMLKFGSWTTSAGFADFYTIMTVSPEYNGNYSNLSMFVSYQDEIRASTDNWSALGMHGNQSGPIVVEGKFDLERMIGSPYDGKKDYIGESIIETNSSRSMTFLLAQSLDTVTKNAKNVGAVTEKMLYACGGSGYKTNLGLERLFRDGKAGCIMAPSNEVLRNLVGVAALTGFTSIDLWEESTNERIINREVRKMTAEEKVAMGQRLLDEAAQEQEGNIAKHPYQESDFDNPFNTAPPAVVREEVKTSDGILHKPALNPDSWTELALSTREDISDKTTSFVFSLPNTTDHTGCLPGQYVTLVLRYETQGIISNHFKALQPGDKVEFQGPCGGFEYVASQLDELILLASGGGVTPALQLIRSLVNSPADPTRFTLLYFSDTYEDILYRSELDGYAS